MASVMRPVFLGVFSQIDSYRNQKETRRVQVTNAERNAKMEIEILFYTRPGIRGMSSKTMGTDYREIKRRNLECKRDQAENMTDDVKSR